MLTKVSLKSAFYLCVVGVFTLFSCSDKRSGDPRVLVFSKTSGFYHQSIPAGNAALQKLAQENGFQIDTTTNEGFHIAFGKCGNHVINALVNALLGAGNDEF